MEEARKKRRLRHCRGVVIIVGFVVAFTVSNVFGNYSYSPTGSPPSGEKTHAQILSQIYGGTFYKMGTNRVDYGNATGVRAWRVYDTDGPNETLHLITGLPSDVDQIWKDGTATITVKAKYASDTQSFGWNQGGTETTYEELLTHLDIETQKEVTLDIENNFLWGCHPDSQMWWSQNSKNLNGEDHMVTYKIENLPNQGDNTVWLICMEDKPFYDSDKDYNDFVVEITAIPEPATLLLLTAGALLLRKRS